MKENKRRIYLIKINPKKLFNNNKKLNKALKFQKIKRILKT